MATTDTSVPQVIVNKLTKAQYDAATKSPTEFYAVTDEDIYSDFTGATSSTAGAHGLVPAPAIGDDTKFLKGDGTWASSLPAVTSGTATVNTAYLTGTARWRKFGRIVLVDFIGGITTAPPGQARVQIVSGLPAAATTPNDGTAGSFVGGDYGTPTRVYNTIIEAGATTLNLVWPPAVTSREANFQFIYIAES